MNTKRRALPVLLERDFRKLAASEGATVEIECVSAPNPDERFSGEWLFYVVSPTGERFLLWAGQAKGGRDHILGEMANALTAPRGQVGEFAPRIETITIPTDKIREVIGSGGKVIREIVEKTGAKIDIQDDGTVKVSASDGSKIKAAIDWIKSIASEPELGAIYDGKVVKVVDFGAFVNFFGAKDGLVHISQLSQNKVAKTSDVVTEGQIVKVKLMGFDDRGKVKLSMKVVDQETGEDLTKREVPAEEAGA